MLVRSKRIMSRSGATWQSPPLPDSPELRQFVQIVNEVLVRNGLAGSPSSGVGFGFIAGLFAIALAGGGTVVVVSQTEWGRGLIEAMKLAFTSNKAQEIDARARLEEQRRTTHSFADEAANKREESLANEFEAQGHPPREARDMAREIVDPDRAQAHRDIDARYDEQIKALEPSSVLPWLLGGALGATLLLLYVMRKSRAKKAT